MKALKKALTLILAFSMLLSVMLFTTSCSSGKDADVINAVRSMEDHYHDTFKDRDLPTSGYLRILNTRKITVKDNAPDRLADVRCVVEFVIYVDFYGMAPYYTNLLHSVTYYKDGHFENLRGGSVIQNFLVMSGDFNADYYEIEDFGDAYNDTINFLL